MKKRRGGGTRSKGEDIETKRGNRRKSSET